MDNLAIYIDGRICKGCGLCVYYCPRDVFVMGKTLNEKGFTLPEVGFPERCVECKMCEINCPDLAIYVSRSRSSDTEKAG
ncbi:MAG: 4Fe-4S dicluster domain-containing protein [Firmicutes bacterium]|nr:4Fe-4S dicluster domain-containing protein [Candidatus Fermentithermobacillaceae bacterium]